MQVAGCELKCNIKIEQQKFKDKLLFIQDKKLYSLKMGQDLVKIELRKSNVKGRHKIQTYAALPNGNLLIYSADFCVSMLDVSSEKSKTWCFLCPHCGQSFADWNKLHKQHLHLHRGPVECPVTLCRKKLEDYHALNIHKKTCCYKCEICFKEFRIEERFVTHMKTHDV